MVDCIINQELQFNLYWCGFISVVNYLEFRRINQNLKKIIVIELHINIAHPLHSAESGINRARLMSTYIFWQD